METTKPNVNLEQILSETSEFTSNHLNPKKEKSFFKIMDQIKKLNPNYSFGKKLETTPKIIRTFKGILNPEYQKITDDSVYLTLETFYSVYTSLLPKKYSELDKKSIDILGF